MQIVVCWLGLYSFINPKLFLVQDKQSIRDYSVGALSGILILLAGGTHRIPAHRVHTYILRLEKERILWPSYRRVIKKAVVESRGLCWVGAVFPGDQGIFAEGWTRVTRKAG